MNARATGTLGAALTAGGVDGAARVELVRQVAGAAVPLAIVAALVGAWIAAAPLSGAVVATGEVKVELNRKTVQHREGGIVREILVRDGQRVRAGDPLVVIGDIRGDAELSLLQDQLAAERVRGARAAAEAAFEGRFAPPADLVREAAGHLAREQALFAARRRTLDEQSAALRGQVREAHAQVAALETQIEATDTGARLAAEELTINEKLAEQGYVQRVRVLGLQRIAADYRARAGEYRGDLASARQRAAEIEARIAQLRNQYQQQAADELRESAARVRELEERLRPSRDQVERQYVRAPVDGEVMALRVAAPGEVIGPRDAILDVVPAREKLVVEARIRPEDIDHVRREGAAEVRLVAPDARRAAPVPGTVVFVSPDRVKGPDGRGAWFVATIEVDAAAIAGRAGARLLPGMPAEVFIATSPRTLLRYLAEPFTAFTERALREP